MRHTGLTGSFWPSRSQEDLLRAALLTEAPAVEAWRRARASLDFDVLEDGSYSLMPLVYRQLSEAGVDEPLLPRLKGIYRHTWSKNQVLLADLRAVLERLAERDVDAWAIGGPARLPYYPEIGLRTVSSVEVLVAPHELDRALTAVEWRGGTVPPRVARGRSHLVVEGEGARRFALHWRLLPEYPADGDELHYATGQSALEPTIELLHTLAGGARTALWANVQWIADAVMIVRSGRVDWDRFVDMAAARRAALRVHEALTYVERLLGVAAPTETISRLAGIPATRRDVIAHRVGSAGGKLLGEFPRTLAGFVRSGHGATGLPGYLRDAWNVERTWQLPVVAARKGAGTLVARRARRRPP